MNHSLFIVISCLLLLPKFNAQTCVDLYLEQLKMSKRLPERKTSCVDEGAYWKYWKEGTKYSRNPDTYWKASYCYEQAYLYGFRFAWFNLEYANFLINRGKLELAIDVLKEIPEDDKLYNNGRLKIAEIMIWIGAYKGSSKILKNIESEPQTQMEQSKTNLLRISDSLSAPTIKQEGYYNLDNQPLSLWGYNFTFRQGRSKLFNYQIQYGNSYFLNDLDAVQTRFLVQNTFSLSRWNTSLNLGIGGTMFGSHTLKRNYQVGLKTQFNSKVVNELKFESKVYDLTRGSIGSVLLVDQITESFLYSRKSGFAFEIYGSYGQLHHTSIGQYNLYSWLLSPFLVRYPLKPRLGVFLGYANSNQILYSSVLTYDQIIDSGNLDQIEGVFPTWFTPNQMKVVGGIVDFEINPTKKLKINSTNTIGIGYSNEPYLFLESNAVQLSSYQKFFIPLDLKVNATFFPNRTLEMKLGYEYRITVFNKAHNIQFSIAKRLK